MKFRIIRKYYCETQEYYYIIQQFRLWGWAKPEHVYLQRPYDSCKSAETSLDSFHLQTITNDVILEKEY